MSNFAELFKKGIELFEAELFWEAIDYFKGAVSIDKQDPLLDDVYLNIAVCYMRLNLFDQAQEWFLPVYYQNVGDGLFDDGDNNVGKTKARAALGLLRICLSKDEIARAEEFLAELDEDESGFVDEKGLTKFVEVGAHEISVYKRTIGEG